MAARKLTPKQLLFVAEYLLSLNATAAAAKAGYKRPNKQGPRLLVNVGIAAAIAAAQLARAGRMEVEADRLLAEVDLLATSDIGDVLDFTGTEPVLRPCSDIPAGARRTIASVKVRRYTEGHGDDAHEVEVTEFKLWSKLDALRLALQRRGLLKTVHEHGGKDGKPIPITLVEVVKAATNPDSEAPE